ncbi:hypothetical protein ACR34G_02310 [Mycoplasma sp. 480]|uniref:hypothetical protein n=2 Tax=Mycoplasma sp. 480 TaxID=3440155 RepID=UPI003F514907
MDEGNDQTYDRYNTKLTEAGNNQLKLDRLKDEAEHKFNTVASVTEGKINGLPDGEDKNNLVRKWQQMLNGPADDKTITKVKEIDAEVTAVINKIDRERELPSLKQYIDMLLDGNAIKNNANEFYNNAIKPNSTATGKDVRDVKGQITNELERLNREAQTYITNKLAGDTSGTKETLIAELNGHVLSQADIKAKKARADEIFNTKKEEVLVFAEKLSEQNKQNTIDKVNGTSDGSVQPAASIERLEQILAQAKTLKQEEDETKIQPAYNAANNFIKKIKMSLQDSKGNFDYTYYNKGVALEQRLKRAKSEQNLEELQHIKEDAEKIWNPIKDEVIAQALNIQNSIKREERINQINNAYNISELTQQINYTKNDVTNENKQYAALRQPARDAIAKLNGDEADKDRLTKLLDSTIDSSEIERIKNEAEKIFNDKLIAVKAKITNKNDYSQDQKTAKYNELNSKTDIEGIISVEKAVDSYNPTNVPLTNEKQAIIDRMYTQGITPPSGSSSSSSSVISYALRPQEIETYINRVKEASTIEEANAIELEYALNSVFDTRRLTHLKNKVTSDINAKLSSNQVDNWRSYWRTDILPAPSINELGKKYVNYRQNNNIGKPGNQSSEEFRKDLLRDWHKWAQEPAIEWAKGLVKQSTNMTIERKYTALNELSQVTSLFDFTDWLSKNHPYDNIIPNSLPQNTNIRFYDGQNYTELK